MKSGGVGRVLSASGHIRKVVGGGGAAYRVMMR